MLRRKFVLTLGSLGVLFVIVAAVGIWSLQGLLEDMDHITTDATEIVDQTNRLNSLTTAIELELYRLQTGARRHLDVLIDSMDLMHRHADEIGEHYVIMEAQSRPVYLRFRDQMEVFERHAGALATAQDPALARQHNLVALEAATQLRGDILEMNQYAFQHARQEQLELTNHFRWLVLGLAIGFLLLINVSAMVLLRMATMILRPVNQLVAATRQLGMERFDHRVQVNQQDEFDELARSFNQLAEQLQTNEQRRIETLTQVAVTLNHELNNAMNIIELQLKLLDRRAGGDSSFETCLKQIRDNLHRMTETVESLKHVQRIVLTDYVAGTKMLDLQRSVEAASSQDASPVDPARTS